MKKLTCLVAMNVMKSTIYNHVLPVIIENERKYTAADVENINFDEQNRPQHAWDELAPGAEHDSGRDCEEGNEIVSNLEQEDIDDNAAILNDPTGSDSISGNGPAQLANRFESAANKDIIPADEYRSLMRGLNTKQREIVMYHRKWCRETTIALKYAIIVFYKI